LDNGNAGVWPGLYRWHPAGLLHSPFSNLKSIISNYFLPREKHQEPRSFFDRINRVNRIFFVGAGPRACPLNQKNYSIPSA